jgi:hypothetical protein
MALTPVLVTPVGAERATLFIHDASLRRERH